MSNLSKYKCKRCYKIVERERNDELCPTHDGCSGSLLLVHEKLTTFEETAIDFSFSPDVESICKGYVDTAALEHMLGKLALPAKFYPQALLERNQNFIPGSIDVTNQDKKD